MKLDLLVIIFIISFSPALAFAHPGHEPENILLEQANDAFLQANFDKVISLLDILLEHNPNNIEALNKKGVILNIQENFVEAQSYFDRVLEINPTFIEALNNKGNSLVGQGHIKQGIQYFDKALEINPTFFNALNNKADSLIKLGKYNEAFNSLNQVMKINPGNKKATANLEFIKYRLDYILNPGFMEIQVYNSQGFLVTHFVEDTLSILNSTIVEDVINEFPVIKTINRDGQDYEVLQRKGIIEENEDSTPARTGLSFSYNDEVMLVFSTHYQFLVEKGDVVVYYTNIFRPVQ